MSFENALNFVLKWEGGYSNHPNDSGGSTNFGITQKTYEMYLVRKKHGMKPVKSISIEEVKEIYKSEFWDRISGDKIKSPMISFALFDWAVNTGVKRAVRHIQECLNIRNDGVMGPNTLSAINNATPIELLFKLLDKRVSFYKKISSKNMRGVFLKGWMNRVEDLKKEIGKTNEFHRIERADPL